MGIFSTISTYYASKADLAAEHRERTALSRQRCADAVDYTMGWMTEKHPEMLVPGESGAHIGLYLAFRAQVAEVARHDCLHIEAANILKVENDRHQFAGKRLRYQAKTQLREDLSALNLLNRLKPRLAS